MRIDGKAIAAKIFEDLTKKVALLKEKGITPHLAIILVGEDPASQAYVRQKVLKAEMIGAKASVINLASTIQNSELLKLIHKFNIDKEIHGIIVQRPLPDHISSEEVNQQTATAKDIDAFKKDSPFTMPLAAAVMKVLEKVYQQIAEEGSSASVSSIPSGSFLNWLHSKNIVVIGKGETGGGPTIELLNKMHIPVTVIDSKTINPKEVMHRADIIVSAVGKSNVIQKENLKPGVILLSVGMHRGKDGKLHGDYDEEDIQDIAAFYSPIPGGVGPVNVAMLLENLLQAAANH